MTETLNTSVYHQIQQKLTAPKSTTLILVLLSLLGISFALISTSKGGLDTTNDSYHFVSAAKSLLAGHGYMRFNNVPFLSWPPLYPTVLAGIAVMSQLFGSDIVQGIRFVQAFEFGFIIFLSGILFLRCFQSRVLALVAVCFVVFSFPLILIAIDIWTEILYVLLSLIFVLYFPTFIREQKVSQFAVLMLIAVLGSMERFAGIGIIPAGMACILLLIRTWSLRKRFIYAALFGLTGIPYILWLIYGTTFSLPPLHLEQTPVETVLRNIQITGDLLTQWFVPVGLRSVIPSGLIYIVLIAIGGWMLYLFYRRKGDVQAGQAVVPIYMGAYMLFFYFAHMIIQSTDIDQRHLSVIYVYVIFLLFFTADRFARSLSPKAWGKPLVVAVALLGLAFPAVHSVGIIRGYAGWCCNEYNWQQSTPVAWLNSQSLTGDFYSNTPLPLFYTPYSVFTVPRTLEEWAALPLMKDRDTYFIWFTHPGQYGSNKTYFYQVPYSADDLATIADVELVSESADVKIYRLHLHGRP